MVKFRFCCSHALDEFSENLQITAALEVKKSQRNLDGDFVRIVISLKEILMTNLIYSNNRACSGELFGNVI